MSSMDADGVQLWVTSDAGDLSAHTSAFYVAMLSLDEKQRWQRFLFPEDRQRFLRARVLVRTVLAKNLHQSDPALLEFASNSYGKPALRVKHCNPPPLHFNLSHTKGLLVLAVSRSCEVGVDVESVRREVALLELSARFFSSEEHEQLMALSGAAQRERFFALWTMKEAWLKARGVGLRVPLNDFSFDFNALHPLLICGRQLHEQAEDWQFRLLHQQHFRIALAIKCASTAALAVQTYEGELLEIMQGFA